MAYIHPIFYYQQDKSLIQLTDTPGGDLVLGELLAGNPKYWMKQGVSAVYIPKKLIFSDWRFESWEDVKLLAFAQAIQELKSQGFDIYFLHDKELVLINANPSQKEIQINASVIDNECIYQLASNQLSLPRDAIHILDHYWVDVLLLGFDNSEKQTLRLSHFLNLISPTQNLLVEKLKSYPHPIQTIIEDEFSDNAALALQTLETQLLNVNVLTEYRMIKTHIMALYQLIQNNADFKSLSELIVIDKSGITPDIENQVMNYLATNLLTQLTNLIAPPRLLYAIPYSIEQRYLMLTHLGLFGYGCKPGLLSQFMKEANNLSKIGIGWMMDLEEDGEINFPKANSLSEIKLQDCVIRKPTFEKLLQATTILTHLSVCETVISEDITSINGAPFKTLQKLVLYNTNLAKIMHLNTILYENTTLETLSLMDNNFPEPNDIELTIHPKSLKKLKELVLRANSYLSKHHEQLIQIAEAPSKLLLSTKNPIAFTKLGLSTLEELCIEDGEQIDENDVFTLVQNNTFLKKLRLTNLALNKVSLNFKPGLHKHLVEIALYNVVISNENYISLIWFPEKLKHLSILPQLIIPIPIAKCKYIEFFVFEMPFELKLETLVGILETMPELKKLIIHCTHNIPSDQLKQIDKKYPQVHIQLCKKFEPAMQAPHQVEPQVVPYNHEQNIHNKPASNHFRFKYQANKSRAQIVIIQQLCQYLQITNTDTHLIPVLNKGICAALTILFEEKTINQWNLYIKSILEWSGQKRTLTPELSEHFYALLQKIKSHQLIQNQPQQFLGDNLEPHLLTITDSISIKNPWHAIAIKRNAIKNAFYFYDPNQELGVIEVTYEQLISTITKTLGTLLQIISTGAAIPEIGNPEVFIAKGGLLSICTCMNHEAILDKIPANTSYSKDSLVDGLRVRTCNGRSAWVAALSHQSQRVQRLLANLLTNLYLIEPNYKEVIQESVEHLTKQEKESLCGILKTVSDLNKPVSESLIHCLETAPEYVDYEAIFETWKNQKPQAQSVSDYLWDCLHNPTINKRLIDCKSNEELQGLQFALEKLCLDANYPYFYIDSPKELISSSIYVQKIENKGVIRKGQGGLLYQFLQNNSDTRPLLIVNYDNFSHETVVRFNDILQGNLLGMHVDVKIIGLRDTTNYSNYNGSDFLSRFDLVEDSPAYSHEFKAFIPILTIKEQTVESIKPIKIFNSPDFESKLVGRWELKADNSLSFEEGALKEALKRSKTLTIEKGLWTDNRFKRFWQQALVRGYVECENDRILISKDITFIDKNSYNWAAYINHVRLLSNAVPSVVLNPDNLNKFIADYRCDNTTHLLKKVPGYIKQKHLRSLKHHRKSSLSVYLTRDLDINSWPRLLEECLTYAVDLELQCAPGVSLPKELGLDAGNVVIDSVPWDKSIPKDDLCLYSTDPDASIAILSQYENWQVLDISELGYSDLIEHLDGKLNNTTLQFEFTRYVAIVQKGLNNRQNWILKGEFPQVLVNQLAPLVLRRRKNPLLSKGQLVLIPSNKGCFNYIETFTHTVSKEDKLMGLSRISALILQQIKPYLDSEPLSCLLARCQFLMLNPSHDNSDNAWIGMRTLEKGPIDLKPLDQHTSEEETELFFRKRLEHTLSVLRQEPYVFLSGLSGVGKSTFVLNELKDFAIIYQGLMAIERWAKPHKKKKFIILFIDEATLEKTQFTLFEGMYNNPPTICINRKLVRLGVNHKVLFAGNPVSYANDRQLATFFIRHGNAVLFSPLPTNVLYEKILKPLCKNTSLEIFSGPVSSIFLLVYQFLANCSEKDLIIGARELEMMLIMTLGFFEKNKTAPVLDIAAFYAYNLSCNLVPQSYKAQFDAYFKPNWTPTFPAVNNKGVFYTTSSRLPLLRLLTNLINVHDLRQSRYANENFLWQGLNCVVIEGKPGIGKSDFILHTLQDNGFSKVCEGFDSGISSRRFYHIAPGMPIVEKEALLCKACDEGAWVLIDEFNSAPTSEALMNDLLMGFIPGKGRPTTPGFLVIITQNPCQQSTGRRQLSTAFNKRSILVTFPEYTPKEMEEILIHKGLHQKRAKQIINAFIKKAEEADTCNYPAPCFRDVLKLVSAVHSTDNIPREGGLQKPHNQATLINPSKVGIFSTSITNATSNQNKTNLIFS